MQSVDKSISNAQKLSATLALRCLLGMAAGNCDAPLLSGLLASPSYPLVF